MSHRVTGSAPFRGLRSNGTTFYLSENPFLFPLKFPDFSPEWKALTLHFPYMKDKVSQTFWPGLHYCIHRTYNGTKQWSLSQHQSVIYKGKVYTVVLPFNKTINNWTILVDTDLTLFFYFLVSGSSPFVQREQQQISSGTQWKDPQSGAFFDSMLSFQDILITNMLSPNSGCLTTHAVEYFNKFITRAAGLLALSYLVMLSLNKVLLTCLLNNHCFTWWFTPPCKVSRFWYSRKFFFCNRKSWALESGMQRTIWIGNSISTGKDWK